MSQFPFVAASQILDRSKLDAAYITFSTMFDLTLARTPTVFQDIATVIPVGSTVTEFKWLGEVPAMTEWIGMRAVNKLKAETHQIRTKDWANGIEVARDDLEDDKLGLIAPRISQLAQEGVWKMEDLVFDLLNDADDGTLALSYDGMPLVDAAHTASGSGGTTQSNRVAGALSEATYQAGWAAFMNLVDSKGMSIRAIPDTLLVGVANRTVARKLINQQHLANGEDNIEAGTTRLIVHPRITGTKWFLLNTRSAVRSIILLLRQAPRFAAADSMDDRQTFMDKNFLYGADARFGAGIGLWQTIVGGPGV